MDNKILMELKSVLEKCDKYLDENNEVLKSKVQSDVLNMNEELISLLLNNEILNKTFFKNVNGILVFDKVSFSWTINSSEFLPNSFTTFKNKIGLIDERDNFISSINDVSLAFPYKDCVLMGGQTKEDEKRNECFLNETLCKNDIDTIFEPKVLKKKYKYNGEIINDFNCTINDNYIIKGNNLIALYSLLPQYEGKIDLIIIDPPYNTNTDSFSYNDSFTHSTWLTFMKNRLEIARRLLSDTGSIYVQIDVKEAHYLKILMDEVFGRNNFRSEIIWDTSIPYVAGNKWLSNNWIYSHSQIFYYAKNKENVYFNKQVFDVLQKSGEISKKPYKDVWCDIENFAGFLGAKDIKIKFNSRKPERLIERIITSSCKEGGIILDFFAGSGTTLAVAHKMNRKYIGIEQMNSQVDIIVERLKQVINGDKLGISKTVNWTGGGSFISCELLKQNQLWIDIVNKSDEKNIDSLYDELLNNPFVVNYKVNIHLMKTAELKDEFVKLNFEDKKKLLIALIDKNNLYVNYSNKDDINLNISEDDIKFSKSFYGEE